MNIIKIKRCTFVEHSQSRADFVENICDVFIRGISDGNIYMTLAMDDFMELFLEFNHSCGPEIRKYGPKESKIRTCEMRLAFRLLQNAGYHIFYNEKLDKYYLTEREYIGTQKIPYTDFKHHID